MNKPFHQETPQLTLKILGNRSASVAKAFLHVNKLKVRLLTKSWEVERGRWSFPQTEAHIPSPFVSPLSCIRMSDSSPTHR